MLNSQESSVFIMLSSNIGSVNKKNSRLIPVRNQTGVSYAPENRQLTVDKWFSSLSLLSQPTMGFFLFWRQMCRTNKIHVSSSVYTTPSYFSAPEGQRFESSRSHQEQHLMGCCSFCYARILWGSKRGGFEQPVPRGLANPFGHAKKRIAMYFCNALFVLMLFWF